MKYDSLSYKVYFVPTCSVFTSPVTNTDNYKTFVYNIIFAFKNSVDKALSFVCALKGHALFQLKVIC